MTPPKQSGLGVLFDDITSMLYCIFGNLGASSDKEKLRRKFNNMVLELHDNEVGNSLTAKIQQIESDQLAEKLVRESAQDPKTMAKKVVKWLLKDEGGILCRWERPLGNTDMPEVTGRSPRFTGAWKKGPKEIEI